MDRSLCEFYRDRGYPQGIPGAGGWIDGLSSLTIHGLLRFLREKLPIRYTIELRDTAGGLWCAAIGTDESGHANVDDDPTTALALAGKAALEALDGQ